MSVVLVKQQSGVSEPLFSGEGESLGVTYAIQLYLVGKLIVDFLYVTIEHFSLALTTEPIIRRNPPLLKLSNQLIMNRIRYP